MTAETEVEGSHSPPTVMETNAEQLVLPSDIVAIFEFLSCNEKIVFKSQQIDDPDLPRSEKVQIARCLYERNRQTFLMRFGGYLEEQHLATFARLAIADGAAPLKYDEHYEEMQLLLHDYRRKLKTRRRDVKNRRYAAMQELIAKGEYFGEQEMMKRAPELYQELVGQYLSESEKTQRDSYDVRNTSFSGILMHQMEQREIADVLKEAEKRLENNEEETSRPMVENEQAVLLQNRERSRCDTPESSMSGDTDDYNSHHDEDEEEVSVPMSCQQQWGNFENETIACSSSSLVYKPKPKLITPTLPTAQNLPKLITGGERELLRQEFEGIMHAQFLAGNDADFDYTEVDDNSQLDDIRQLNQDEEDAYFEASENEDDDLVDSGRLEGEEEQQDLIDANGVPMERHLSTESDDELDIYMSHLAKHHSLQK